MTGEQAIKSLVSSQEWKTVPIVIGKSAPKGNDLIQFEELSNYSFVAAHSTADVTSPKSSGKLYSKQKQDRIKRRKQLRKVLITGDEARNDSRNVLTCSDNGVSPKTKQKLPQKINKRKGDRTKNKPTKKPKTGDELKTIEDDEKLDVDEESVYRDMAAWNELLVPFPVLKALHELKFHNPMPIQQKVLPVAIRDRRDVLAAAETGSGKTLAFGIPLLQHLIEDKIRNLEDDTTMESNTTLSAYDQSTLPELELEEDFDDEALQIDKKPGLSALILTPTRELAIQVKNHIVKVAKYTDIRVVALVGGMSVQKQVRQLKNRPDLIIATPGRLWELVDDGNPHVDKLNTLKYLVIDEADRMFEKGHFEHLDKLLDIINDKSSKTRRQIMIFSATLTSTHETTSRMKMKAGYEVETTQLKLEKLSKKLGIDGKAHVVDLTTTKVTAEKLTETKIMCSTAEKDFYLYYFLKSNPGRTLVFVNSIDCIFRLAGIFEALKCKPLHLHAKMQQRQRLKHLDRFHADPDAVLFASDVAARGLDIADVNYVVHYQVPRTMETYVHRSGRCARSGKDGLSLLLVSPEEMTFYKRVCRALCKPGGFPLFEVDTSCMATVKNRVKLAREVDKLSHQQKKVRLHNDWFSKAAAEADLCIDDDMMLESDVNGQHTCLLKNKKKQLEKLIKKPIFPKGFSGKFITKSGRLMAPDFRFAEAC